MNTQINADDSSTSLTAAATTEWDGDSENTPVYAVVSAVGDAEGADPVDLPPLYNAVDPEALNDLFMSRANSAVGTVEFEYAGYIVIVRGEGTVEVRSIHES
ncbi:HalOD1 output domain-containing protein [Natronorubrum sp. A-ect3]|uniref:HalOD1 output domain-containing protein n=1 Tax=Natronorubrum sp. A-ect3 TaxID=3242698 RepID=UPI00359D3AFE